MPLKSIPNPSSAPCGGDGEEAGLFAWDVVSDQVYADGAVARVFGFDKTSAARGMPIAAYLERIHAGDKKAVAKRIHDAILFGQPYHAEYRTVVENTVLADVAAFGKCFRGADGEPSYYAGVICSRSDIGLMSDPLLWHCLEAYDLAKREGNESIIQSLTDTLTTIRIARRQQRH